MFFYKKLFYLFLFFVIDECHGGCHVNIQKASPTQASPTQASPTELASPTEICPLFGEPFLRKRGYWCSMHEPTGRTDWRSANEICKRKGGQLSGLETNEEFEYYLKQVKEREARSNNMRQHTGSWVGVEVSPTNPGVYVWSDPLMSNNTIDPQPLNTFPDGVPSFIWNLEENVPGYGHFEKVPADGERNQNGISMIICGYEGGKPRK